MGALTGFKIVEIAGIGPGQFCGMLLADMGAKIIRVERIDDAGNDAGIRTAPLLHARITASTIPAANARSISAATKIEMQRSCTLRCHSSFRTCSAILLLKDA